MAFEIKEHEEKLREIFLDIINKGTFPCGYIIPAGDCEMCIGLYIDKNKKPKKFGERLAYEEQKDTIEELETGELASLVFDGCHESDNGFEGVNWATLMNMKEVYDDLEEENR